MPVVLGYLLLVALLFAGSAGWGSVTVRLFERLGWAEARRAVTPSLRLLLGVSLFLGIGGVLVACDVAYFGVLMAWHAVGALLLAPRLVRALRSAGNARRDARIRALAVSAVVAVLGLVAIGTAMGMGTRNVFDDDSAYIYFAKRLLATGGLIDPFNYRRLTDYGGSTLYQSLFYQVSGGSSLRGFEFTFASLLLVVVTVDTVRRRWLIPGTILVGSVVVAGFGLGSVVNLSPECSVAALTLGIFRLLTRVRQGSHPFLYVAIGLMAGAVASLRTTYLVSVGVAVVLVVACKVAWRGVRGLAVAAGVVALFCAGWAAALYRSSGTLFYPLFAGNADTTWPAGRNPGISTVGQYLRLFWSAFSSDAIGLVALVSMVIAVAFLVAGGRTGPYVELLAAGTASLVQLVVFVYTFSGLSLVGIVRYEAPSTLACGLFAVGIFWPEESTERAPPAVPSRAGPRWTPQRAGAAALVVFPVAMVLLVAGTSPVTFVRSTFDSGRLGTEVLASAKGFGDHYALYRPEYSAISAKIPAGSSVLAAVDYPALLDASRYRFATLDIAGAASPPPHLPFFQGAAAKVRYLRQVGIQYVVAESPSVEGLYWGAFYTRLALYNTDYHERSWTPYMIDWQGSVSAMESDGRYQTWHDNTLTLIRIAP
ncbi:MAG TPA: hypothetical protein VLZ77_04335 [Acidimicrobiales bacterium]|nr:hypothetical protein [Acidimicrobiales bacterium]